MLATHQNLNSFYIRFFFVVVNSLRPRKLCQLVKVCMRACCCYCCRIVKFCGFVVGVGVRMKCQVRCLSLSFRAGKLNLTARVVNI